MNELQKKTLEEINKMLPGSHYIDLIIRTGGKDHRFEADFLKQILPKYKELCK